MKHVGVNYKGIGERDAFLLGVSTATAARNSFMDSDYLEEWRERNGVAKRGPKRTEAEQVAETKRRTNRAVISDDEFEPEEDDAEVEDDDFEEADDADSDDDDFEDDSDEDDSDEDDDFEDEPEPAPVARKRAPTKAAAKPATRGTRRKAAATDDEDDENLF